PLSCVPIVPPPPPLLTLLFFNHTAPPELSPLSLHDALPICRLLSHLDCTGGDATTPAATPAPPRSPSPHRTRAAGTSWLCYWQRSEEHTSELQSLTNLVCRLLLEKKKSKRKTTQGSCGHSLA